MYFSSYIEINVICMLLLGIIYVRVFQNRSIITTSQINMKRTILASCILCLSDIAAIICRGQSFVGARALVEISNLIYIEAMPLISFFWFSYVCDKVGKSFKTYERMLLLMPVLAFTAIAISNPMTNFLFSIDDQNLYSRGPGVFLHWIASWFYLFSAGAISHIAYKSSSSWNKRSEYKPLLLFLVFPAIGCVVQMLFYGVSSVQAGITLSIVLVNLQMQDNNISIDELTGINNRKELTNYVDAIVNKSRSSLLNVIMIDVNDFKKINDTLGHKAGDEALQYITGALKTACEKNNDEHLFLCRFGGDEFIIISQSDDEEQYKNLKLAINQEIKSSSKQLGYPLSVSIGHNVCQCKTIDDFNNCIKQADKDMYIEKQTIKRR